MQLKNKSIVIKSVLNQRLFKKRTPLSVSWTLTNRCNKKCIYCNLPNIYSKELTTKQIFSIIDELAELGTQRIGFTGGEPLLRNDIKEILDYSHNKGLFTGMVTNGSLVTRSIDKIKNLDLLQLSIDGPGEINDEQRYKGSYKEVINAIKATKGKIPKVWLTCVLTKDNLNSINFILDLTKQYNLKVFFQPVADYKNCGPEAKNMFPDKEKYKDTIRKLIELKKTNKQIGNSKTGLEYLLNWPVYKRMNCYAGELFAHIYPNGDVYPCFNMDGKKPINCLKNGFRNAFEQINRNGCDCCFTYTTVELNHSFDLNINAGWNSLKLLR